MRTRWSQIRLAADYGQDDVLCDISRDARARATRGWGESRQTSTLGARRERLDERRRARFELNLRREENERKQGAKRWI